MTVERKFSLTTSKVITPALTGAQRLAVFLAACRSTFRTRRGRRCPIQSRRSHARASLKSASATVLRRRRSPTEKRSR